MKTGGDGIGTFEDQFSTAFFFVQDSTLVHVAIPWSRKVGDNWQDYDLKVRAVDLTSGTVRWERTLRDVQYTGPLPP